MTASLIALTLSASLAGAALTSASPSGVRSPAPSLLAEALRIEAAGVPTSRAGQARKDSLRNGAIAGGVAGGGAMLVWGALSCRETSCAPDVLLWTALAAGAGAAIGAGLDALFDRRP